VGAGREVFVLIGQLLRVLADEAGASRDRAVHSDSVFLSAEPLSPSIALGTLNPRAEVIAEDIRQRAHTVRSGVALVYVPALHLHRVNGAIDLRIIAPRKASPCVDDLLQRLVRIPRELAIAIQVRH